MFTVQLEAPGLVAQELRERAEAIRRESRKRGNGGANLAHYRDRLRNKADDLDRAADSIEQQLRAQHRAQETGARRMEILRRTGGAVVMERRPFTITKLARHGDGYWTARSSCEGTTVEVDNRYGSWQANVRVRPGARKFARRFVLPHVAAELQRKVKAAARREGVSA